MLETRHLIYFKAVAEHLNFTRAAESLNMSQPPLSYQIKQLEEFLDVELFHRTNRTVELTEAGEYFYKITIQILNNLVKQVETVRKIAKGEIGLLRIGFGGSIVYDILPKIIQHIHSTYPTLKLDVQQLTTSQQINALRDGDLDVGILVPPVKEPEIHTLPIRQEEFIVCLHKDHPLADAEEPLSIADFRDDNIIMTPYQAGSGYYESVMNLCRIGGFSPNITQTAQEQHTIVSLVSSGIGTAFVPLSSSKINQDNVVYRKLKEKVYKQTAVAWHSNNPSPVVELFLFLMKENILES